MYKHFFIFFCLHLNINKCFDFKKITDKLKKIDQVCNTNLDKIDSAFLYVINHIFNNADDTKTSDNTNKNSKNSNFIGVLDNLSSDKNTHTTDLSFSQYIKLLKQKINYIHSIFNFKDIYKSYLDASSKKRKRIHRSEYPSFIDFINKLNEYSILSSNNWSLFSENVLFEKMIENIYILSISQLKPKKLFYEYIKNMFKLN